MLTAFLNLEVLVTCGVFFLFFLWLYFLFPSMSLPTMHRFTCKLLSVVCGECTKFKHINKHFNFQMVSFLYSRTRLVSLSSHRALAKPVGTFPHLFSHLSFTSHLWRMYWYWDCLFCPAQSLLWYFRSCWALWREGGMKLNHCAGLVNSVISPRCSC